MCRPVLHWYVDDHRLIGFQSQNQAEEEIAAALRSHLDCICRASSKWRKERGGCDEIWHEQGTGDTSPLGLLLASPDKYESDTQDAAVSVLETVRTPISCFPNHPF